MRPPRPGRFHKFAPWLFRGAVAIAVLGLIVLNQLNASHRASKIAAPGAQIVVPFTGFGGYNWTGTVKTIGAQWSVPKIATTSNFGGASTWIGVQNDVNNQFVQVGIDENDSGNGPVQYQAFWSDLQVGFSPKPFGEVYPGDVISVSMSRNARGWALHFADLTRKLTGKAFVSLPPSVPFTQGEWIQEDPTDSTNTSQDIPYPQLSAVTFHDLKINGSTPALRLNDGQVLIASSGAISVPSPVFNDSFSLTAPTGFALDYLDDEQLLDAALNKFDDQLTSWNSASITTKTSTATSLSDALRADATGLSSQKWPTSSRSVVEQLIQSDQLQLKNLASWSADHYGAHGAAFAHIQLQLFRNETLINSFRSTLGLPPL